MNFETIKVEDTMEFNFFDWLRDGVKRSVFEAVQTECLQQEEKAVNEKCFNFEERDRDIHLCLPGPKLERDTEGVWPVR